MWVGAVFAAALGWQPALGAAAVDKAKVDAALRGFIESKALVGISAWSTRMATRRTSALSARLTARPINP